MSIEENRKFQYHDNFNRKKYDTQDNDLDKTSNTQSNDLENNNPIQRKIEIVTKYLKRYNSRILGEVLLNNPDNANTICDYIIAEQNEINIKESTKETKIQKIAHLSKYFHHRKTFYDMTKDDLLNYLNNLRKSSIEDPTHKSIGT